MEVVKDDDPFERVGGRVDARDDASGKSVHRGQRWGPWLLVVVLGAGAWVA
jgi:hypothetical protein